MISERLFYGFAAETVFDPQTLAEGESLLSLVARTTLANELPNITTILRDAGQRHRNSAVDIMRMDIDVEGLATILGQDLKITQALRAQGAGSGLIRYLGSVIKTGDVHTRARRYAPATLASDESPYYRASWLIRTFPVCVESWQALRTTCDCGAVQTWATVSSLVHCNSCGDDLRDQSAEVISEGYRRGLSFLAAILFGDAISRAAAVAQLPTELQVLDPGQIFELALLMARIVDPTMPNPRERVWRDDPARLARALSVAGPILKHWPRTPWLALEAAGDTRAMLPRCPALKALYRVLSGKWTGNIGASPRAMLQTLRSQMTAGDDCTIELTDLEGAAEILRIGKPRVRAARASGLLGAHFIIRQGEVLPAYHRDEIASIAATVSWPSATVAGKLIGLPSYAIEQLSAMGLLNWAKAPVRTLQEGLHLQPDSVDAFQNSLRASATALEHMAEPIPINTVMRGIGGREKPWGPVLQGLIAGKWVYSLGRQGSVVRAIYVEASDVSEMRQITFNWNEWPSFPFSRCIHQTDVCDILNVPNRSRHVIKDQAGEYRRRKWVFSREAVLTLSAKIVTSAELQARNFMETKPTMACIRRARLTPVAFGFDRASALENFEAAILR